MRFFHAAASAGLALALAVAGCLADPPVVEGSADEVPVQGIELARDNAQGCASVNLHGYLPLADAQALLPDGFIAAVYATPEPAATGFLGLTMMSCSTSSEGAPWVTAEVAVLVEPPVVVADVEQFAAGTRVPRSEAELSLDLYLVGAYAGTPGHLERLHQAGVPAVAGTLGLEMFRTDQAAELRAELRSAQGDLDGEASVAAPLVKYDGVSTRLWHMDGAQLTLIERFAPNPVYTFPGAQACVLRPGSEAALWMARPTCQPAQGSGTLDSDWTGGMYAFPSGALLVG